MKTPILDFRRNMRQILSALDHNESVTLTYRGKVKGTIIPKRQSSKIDLKKHLAFGIWSDRSIKELKLKIFKPA